uniref:Transmembrane protein 61 n=1 Tax=Anser cygnoides TaxID=8845 RepID=A0A8B9EQ99_ANSCY
MAAASLRYGVTITGAVLLVTGTLCFAWWSDGEVGSSAGAGARLLPPREAQAVPSSSNALLRSVSFFCCGIGGILLLFGLLWSVKANARVVSRRYQYHFPRDLQYFTAEPLEKWSHRWFLLHGSCCVAPCPPGARQHLARSPLASKRAEPARVPPPAHTPPCSGLVCWGRGMLQATGSWGAPTGGHWGAPAGGCRDAPADGMHCRVSSPSLPAPGTPAPSPPTKKP